MTSLRRSQTLKRRRGSPAQALVEFSLVAPLFLVMVFGIIDFGRYVYYVEVLNNAAREGARYAIVHGSHSLNPSGPPESGTTSADPTGANVISVVSDYSTGVVGSIPSDLSIVVHWCSTAACPDDPPGTPDGDGTNARGNTVTVNVVYQFHSLVPVIPIPAIQIEGASSLVINN